MSSLSLENCPNKCEVTRAFCAQCEDGVGGGEAAAEGSDNADGGGRAEG